MKEIVFTHSSSIGLRECTVKKSMLRREVAEVQTAYGKVKVKQSYLKGKMVNSKPEYEDLKKGATAHNVSITEVENAVIKKLTEK